MIDTACQFASSEGFAEEGQRIIITVGVPLGTPGATNMLRIAQDWKEESAELNILLALGLVPEQRF